jgi:hypothetical protein
MEKLTFPTSAVSEALPILFITVVEPTFTVVENAWVVPVCR